MNNQFTRQIAKIYNPISQHIPSLICLAIFLCGTISILLYRFNFYSINFVETGNIDRSFSFYLFSFADLMIQLFGLTSYISFAYIGLFLCQRIFTISRFYTILKFIIYAPLCILISISLTLFNTSEDTVFINGYGGYVFEYFTHHIFLESYLYMALGFSILLAYIYFFYIKIRSIFQQEKQVRQSKNNKRKKKAKGTKQTKSSNIRNSSYDNDIDYIFPDISLLSNIRSSKSYNESELEDYAQKLMTTLNDFGIYGEILEYMSGPVVTLFKLQPNAGTKSSRIIGLAEDLARSMGALSTRISVISGENALGIELPNKKRKMVSFRSMISNNNYKDENIQIPLALGEDIFGKPIVVDLSTMPHLLIAGTTGSGKSVGINTMILSILYRLSPDECRFIMIDPKMLELSIYNGIPHLLTPVVTEPEKAVAALKWAVKEMEQRYRLLADLNVRNIRNYNEKLLKVSNIESDMNHEHLPYIVVIVDEMADLMLVAGKEIEVSIQRLAQMARAAGIHIVMATQRPSVDVITGVIKANFPTRISFQVTSKIDSRTILGEQGAEQLLGKGDMLYMAGGGKVTRIHGAFVSDEEVEAIVKSIRVKDEQVLYSNNVMEDIERISNNEEIVNTLGSNENKDEDLYQKAVQVVLSSKKTSISYVQRSLRIGYNKAANLIDRMEQEGILSEPDTNGRRRLLKE